MPASPSLLPAALLLSTALRLAAALLLPAGLLLLRVLHGGSNHAEASHHRYGTRKEPAPALSYAIARHEILQTRTTLS